MSLHGIANGKCEYSSIIVNMFTFLLDDGNVPLKSVLRIQKVEWPLLDVN